MHMYIHTWISHIVLIKYVCKCTIDNVEFFHEDFSTKFYYNHHEQT